MGRENKTQGCVGSEVRVERTGLGGVVCENSQDTLYEILKYIHFEIK